MTIGIVLVASLTARTAQPIVAVAEDLACVDMVDGRLIENLHVDDGRLLEASPWERLIGKVAAVTGGAGGIGEATVRWPSALAARSARAAVGARSGGDEGFSFLGTPGIVG